MTPEKDSFLATLDPDIAAVVGAGIARAARKPNNMARVAAALPLRRQALFHITYAVMRAIDDFVDEDFMARPAADRSAARAEALATIDRWQRQAEAASAGRFVAQADSLSPDLFGVMNRVVGASGIGPGPWVALAGAMRADIGEGDLADWNDFDAYAEGAAVAPASIFIYMLAADIADDLSSSAALDRPAADYARDLARFCYLVHILRDLSQDAGRADRLLTLPGRTLTSCGLDKPALARAVAGDRSVDLRPLVAAVGDRAEVCRRAARDALAALTPQIGARETQVIETLYALYDAQFEAIRTDPAGVADGSVVLDADVIAAILAPLARAA